MAAAGPSQYAYEYITAVPHLSNDSRIPLWPDPPEARQLRESRDHVKVVITSPVNTRCLNCINTGFEFVVLKSSRVWSLLIIITLDIKLKKKKILNAYSNLNNVFTRLRLQKQRNVTNVCCMFMWGNETKYRANKSVSEIFCICKAV